MLRRWRKIWEIMQLKAWLSSTPRQAIPCFDRPGVVRADGSQYVGMQDTEAEALRAEALSGRDLVFVHNHPNGNDASEEDLDSAFRAGAELLIVITPQGQEFVYIRGKYGMVKVRDDKASYKVGPMNPEETEKLRIRSEAQAWAFQHDSPELIFLQEDPNQLPNDVYKPEGLTGVQAAVMFKQFYRLASGGKEWNSEDIDPEGYQTLLKDWEEFWKEDSGTWPEKAKLEELMMPGGVIEQAVHDWIHPASGMSDDEFAALLLAHLRQEGHYRRKYSPYLADQWENFGDFWKNTFSEDSSVGPANLRRTTGNQILGTAIATAQIPMPDSFPVGSIRFHESYKLDELVGEQWRYLDRRAREILHVDRSRAKLAEQEVLLEDDVIAIQLAAANINRGVERLYRQYLYHELGLEDEKAIQQYLKDNGLQQADLEERYLQQEKYRASMFNMLAWSSQGIAESDTLRNHGGRNADIARVHASGGVRTVHAILVQGLFGLTMDADGVRLFNDDDVYAYREA